ncbi:MAG: hypothetical protein E6J92_08185 [Methanobacteriota archaeon]|nr:MAG: hypothetical protein E6K00_03905 [Euryarchaeota archaeon]TLZ96332.1 MAG: hypothetical protein E6J96_08885 [Euryarchaeota archaeon]TMA01036.1 MAG: hypothetical protein E6J92_08185 [Euryarchaeota archaeon]
MGEMLQTKGIVGIAVAVVLGLLLVAPLTMAKGTRIELQAGPFAPGASGEITFLMEGGVLSGELKARALPAQGVHAFYILWFVRTDLGDKAFLGPVVSENSILFLTDGTGRLEFRAEAFTDGPHAGSSVSLGAAGNNLFVLIAENQIDTVMPFPVSPPPSSFALMATF